jgi:hypothetical protein
MASSSLVRRSEVCGSSRAEPTLTLAHMAPLRRRCTYTIITIVLHYYTLSVHDDLVGSRTKVLEDQDEIAHHLVLSMYLPNATYQLTEYCTDAGNVNLADTLQTSERPTLSFLYRPSHLYLLLYQEAAGPCPTFQTLNLSRIDCE